MSFYRETIDQLEDALDNSEHVDGRIMPLRFFNASQCRLHSDPAVVEAAQIIDLVPGVATLGEAVARMRAFADATPHDCARCQFGKAVADLVYAGEHLDEHVPAEGEAALTDSERALLNLAREWLADETIAQCLEADEQ